MAAADERKPNMTDAQFYYKSRKKARAVQTSCGRSGRSQRMRLPGLEDQFALFYQKLNVTDTRDLIDRLVTVVEYHQPKPASVRAATTWAWLTDPTLTLQSARSCIGVGALSFFSGQRDDPLAGFSAHNSHRSDL